jgi:hypothetical protein
VQIQTLNIFRAAFSTHFSHIMHATSPVHLILAIYATAPSILRKATRVSTGHAAAHAEMWRLQDPVTQPVLSNPIQGVGAAIQRILQSSGYGRN